MAQRSQLPSLFGGSSLARSALDPFSIVDRLLGGIAQGGGGQPGAAETPAIMAPRIDVSETDHDIKVRAELPGVDQKGVEVVVTDDLLTIRGEKRIEHDETVENFHLVERTFGSFVRNIRLPFAADPKEVQADFENGVLTITLPKPAGQRPRASRIEVRSAGQQGGASSQSLKNAADELRSANAPESTSASAEHQQEDAGQRAETAAGRR